MPAFAMFTRTLGFLLLGLSLAAPGARAGMPEFQAFPSAGGRLLLWVASEHGRSDAELEAARKLAARGVEVWSLDPLNAYFLPQLPSSMDKIPVPDLADWMRAAEAGGKQVTVVAVARAAAPVLRAASSLEMAQRGRLCVLLLQPNLYTVAAPLAAPDYLDVGDLRGVRVRVLQPRRSAATPWLPGLLDHLVRHGATVSDETLERLRESYWARESPTEFELAEGRRMDDMLRNELDDWGCK